MSVNASSGLGTIAEPVEAGRFVYDAADPRRLEQAVDDLRSGFAAWRLAWALARLDLTNRYRGSIIGPFWLSLSTAVMLAGLGVVYSRLLHLTLSDYLPHLTVSLVIWGSIAGLIAEAVTTMTASEGVIRQIRIPYTVHALRTVFRNAMTLAHSIPLVLIVFLLFRSNPGWGGLMALPGLGLIFVDGLLAALLLGIVCARFRDIGPIVANAMQLAFFVTPVLWKPELLHEAAAYLPLNPFYVVLETVRGPLVEGGASLVIWGAALGYTLVLVGLTVAVMARFRGRLAFWV